MPDKTWKSIERKLARMFGTERNQDTHGLDFLTDRIAAEVKHREFFPNWLMDAMAQIEVAYQPVIRRIPVLFLHMKGQPIGKTLAVMSADDLKKLLDDHQEEG